MAFRAWNVLLKIKEKTQFSIEILIDTKAWPKNLLTRPIGLSGSVAALQASSGKTMQRSNHVQPAAGPGPWADADRSRKRCSRCKPGPRPVTLGDLAGMGADVPYLDGRSGSDFSVLNRSQAHYRSFSTAFIEDNIHLPGLTEHARGFGMACRFCVNSRGFAGRAMAGRRP